MMTETTKDKFFMYRILEISEHYEPKLKISWKFKIPIYEKLSDF